MEKNNEKIILFLTFNNVMEAEIVKSKLESYEIPCSITGQDAMYFNPLFDPSNKMIKLNIFERDYEVAMKVLSEDASMSEHLAYRDNLHCPKCGSSNIDSYNKEKKKFNLLTFILSIFMVALPAKTEIIYRCNDCGHEFRSLN